MRRYVSLILLLVMIFPALSGCEPAERNDRGSDKIMVMATIFAPYDFAREVAGNKADVVMLLPPGADAHSHELSVRDTIALQNADVFIHIGGGSDFWARRVLGALNTENIKLVPLMDSISPLREEIVEGMETGHEDCEPCHEHHIKNLPYDEHIWTSPANAKLIVQRIADALSEADPRNAEYYRQNAAEYIERLYELDNAFMEVAANGVRNTIVFGDRFPFRYFAHRYGLRYYAAFPGCSGQTEPSARTLTFLIDKIIEENIPVVFHIELSNQKIADTISAQTGAKKLLLHSAHNISRDDFSAGVTYMCLMIRNVETLRKALN